MTYRVSVIIPNYNHAVYLQERIESILGQTFQDFEILILDDCSTDNSKEVIENYRNCNKISKIIYNTTNSGSTFLQWKKGISLASGKYIWLAESDDWCEPTFLENILRGLESNNNCVLGYCQSYCVSDANNIRFQSSHNKIEEYINSEVFIENYMITKNSIFNASMAVWKKEAFVNVSTEFTNFKLCGDWLFWITLCKNSDVFVSGKVLNYFRKHDKDVSTNAYSSGLNFIEEIKLLSYLFKNSLISYPTYLKGYISKFISFEKSKGSLLVQKRKEIRQHFYQDPKIRKEIKKIMLKTYFTRFINLPIKFIIKLVS